MPPYIKKKRVLIPAVMLLLTGLYALAGFLWAPSLLRGALLDGIKKNTGLTARVGEIHVNPFLLQLEVKDFHLPDAAGAKLLGFGRLFVDFEVSSLWHRAYVFQDIEIAAPYAYAIISPTGRLNLAALKPPPAANVPPPAAAKSDAPLPAIQIASFTVSRGIASYEDDSRPNPVAAKLDPISFELKDFTTGAEGGRFKFTGASKLGERLQWQGHFSVQPLESDGDFQVSGLLAHTLWNYIKGQVGFFINSGSIDLNGRYTFALKDKPDLQLTLAKLSVQGLGVRPDPQSEDWISVPNFTVSGTSLDLAKRRVHLDSIAIEDAKVRAWRDAEGSVNLLRLAQAPAAESKPLPTATVQPATDAKADAEPWQVELARFDLARANLALEDRAVRPAAQFAITPLNVAVTAISLDMSKPLTVNLDTGINEGGHLAVSGSLTPSPLSTDLKVNLAGLGLAAVQPYLAQHTAMTLDQGRLNVDGTVHAAPPAIKFAGNVSVDRLHTVDTAMRRDFISWNRLQIQKIDFSLKPDRLNIDTITANKLYARVAIAPNRSLNVATILAGPHPPPAESADTGAPDVGTPGVATPGVATPPEPTKKTRARGKSAASAASAPAGPAPMPISIRRILVQSSTANFSDFSVQPNFSTGIQALEGSVTGLSSRPGSRAKVDLHGQVDRFSPVEIRGEVNVLSAALYTDLSMSFRNMELTTFNPYSGKFAGYNIAKGKLTTELSYKIDGRKLNAGHHIIVDQLEFGAKTESKDAVSLPVKLAVALLKDRHGVIDLDIPVTGSLDDPHFRLGPIIWKVVVNILVKIVTSPFALLGSLFGGGPDMQFVDFPAGIATLDAAGQTKLKTIVKALSERPQLKISVPLASVPDLDRPALLEAHLQALLEEQQRQQAGRKKGTEAPSVPAFDSLPVAAQMDLLMAVYKKELGAAPTFPPPAEPAPAAGQPAPTKAELKAQTTQANIEFLRQSLLKSLTVGEPELKALAQHRAEAIQQVLLTDTQIDPSRVFIVANDKAKPQDHAIRLELTLE